MNKYLLVEINKDGSGYMKIFLDTGESYGQRFVDAPVDNDIEFDNWVAAQIRGRAELDVEEKAQEKRVVNTGITGKLNVLSDVVKR